MSTLAATDASLVERITHGFEDNKRLQQALALLNRLPLPFERMPVRIGNHHLYAQNFDRFLALWLWKICGVEAEESRLLDELCQPGACAVDIGTNIGLHTLELARLVGCEGKVFAFEADRSNFEALERNLKENGYPQVQAFHAAVGAESGEAFIYKSNANSGDHRIFGAATGREREAVRMLALDDAIPPGTRIHFIKMDIQGAEGFALQGMRRVLAENPGLNMMVEFWPFGLSEAGFKPAEVLGKLLSLGCTLEVIGEYPSEARQITNPERFVAGLNPGVFLNLLARMPAARQAPATPVQSEP